MEKSISMGSVAERLLDYIDTAMQHDTNYEIATTLVKNYSKLSELSIGEIADMCFVSKASVSRFCRFMGFADFKDLRNQLEHDVLKTGLFPHAFVEQLKRHGRRSGILPGGDPAQYRNDRLGGKHRETARHCR